MFTIFLTDLRNGFSLRSSVLLYIKKIMHYRFADILFLEDFEIKFKREKKHKV